MAKGRGKSGGTRNDNRKCGKAWKKNPRKQSKTGRTIGGYSPAKLKIREYKRQNYIEFNREVSPDE
jgi:hypothetical protein